MRWLAQLRMKFQMLFHRIRAGRQLDDELQFHLDRQIAENAAAGMPPDEARAAALENLTITTMDQVFEDSYGCQRLAVLLPVLCGLRSGPPLLTPCRL